jgi:hypothetical protein
MNSEKAVTACILSLAFVLLAGCATIFRGSYQEVHIDSVPSGAEGSVDDMKVKTPVTVKLARKQPHVVTLSKEGYEDNTVKINSDFAMDWFIVDILLWGPFGFFDLKGAAYALDQPSVFAYLKSLQAGETFEEVAVTKERCSLYKAPIGGVFQKEVGKLPARCRVEIRGERYVFYKVASTGFPEGWVKKSSIERRIRVNRPFSQEEGLRLLYEQAKADKLYDSFDNIEIRILDWKQDGEDWKARVSISGVSKTSGVMKEKVVDVLFKKQNGNGSL